MPTSRFNLTSSQNPKIKTLLSLKERKGREKTSLFLIEGYREIQRACASSLSFHSLYICPDLFLGENEEELLQTCSCEIYVLPPFLFEKISYRDRPDGLLAIAPQMHKTLSAIPLYTKNRAPFVVVAEAIEKPGNLGTILRSADAVGADAVIVCDRCTDIYNPNVVRASVGTLFTLPVVEATSTDTLHWLQEHKIQVVAATPEASLDYTQGDFSLPTAIVVGTEQIGLSPLWKQKAGVQVSIPMLGVADSLNVATATTLLLYEVLRQRRHLT